MASKPKLPTSSKRGKRAAVSNAPRAARGSVDEDKFCLWREAVLRFAAAGVPPEDWPRALERSPRSKRPPERVADEDRWGMLLYRLSRWDFDDQRLRRLPDQLVLRVATAIKGRINVLNEDDARREEWSHQLALGLLGDVAARLSGTYIDQQEAGRLADDALAALPDPLGLVRAHRMVNEIERSGTDRTSVSGHANDGQWLFRGDDRRRGWILGYQEGDGEWLYQVDTVVCFKKSEVLAAERKAERSGPPPAMRPQYFADRPQAFVRAEDAAPHLIRSRKPPTIWPDLYWRNSLQRGSPLPATFKECMRWGGGLFAGDLGDDTFRRPNTFRRDEKLPLGFDQISASGTLVEGTVFGYEPVELFMIEGAVNALIAAANQRPAKPPARWHADLERILQGERGISAKDAEDRLAAMPGYSAAKNGSGVVVPSGKTVTHDAIANRLSLLRSAVASQNHDDSHDESP